MPGYEYVRSKDCHGVTEHRLNGKLHRLDGPAVERPGGDFEWFAEGQRHCLTGPALKSGDMELYFIDGTEIPKSEFLALLAKAAPSKRKYAF